MRYSEEQLASLKHFKAKLSDYNYIKHKISNIRLQIEEFETKRGVHAVRYDVEHTGSVNHQLLELRRLENADIADDLEFQLSRYLNKLEEINRYLDQSEYKEAIIRIYCQNTSTFAIEANRLYMDRKTLIRRINKEILKYVGTRDTNFKG